MLSMDIPALLNPVRRGRRPQEFEKGLLWDAQMILSKPGVLGEPHFGQDVYTTAQEHHYVSRSICWKK